MTQAQVQSEYGSRGWVVVGAAFVTMALLYGLWYSYSVFLVALLKEFGWSRSVTAGAFSVFALVHAGVGPLFGPFAERVGPRRIIFAGGCVLALGLLLTAETSQPWHLYLAFGFIAAIGIGFSGYVPLVILIRGWFPARIGTAAGVATAGISMGIATLIPVCQFLIDEVGWRWALRLLAVAVVCWLTPATIWLLRESPDPSTHLPRASAQAASQAKPSYWTLSAALRSWRFWGLGIVLFTSNIAVTVLMIHQVAYLATGGINYSSIYASSLNSSWHLKLDIFDATLSRPYYQGRKLTVTPFGGMRGALIRQNLRIDSMLLYGAGSSSNAVSHNHSHCWSVGPRAGLQAHWLLSWGLRLEGDLAGSALYTQYTTVAMRSDATPSNPTVGDASVRYKNYGTIRPMTEMNLGMGWGSYFDRQNYCFDLLATYDFNVMWNQNMIRALQNTENTLSSSNAPDLYIQGLTLTARLDF